VILTREKTRSESRLNEYRQLVPASFQKHPGKFRAMHGSHRVRKASAIEEIVILEFAEAIAMVRDGRITDAKTVAALLWVEKFSSF